MSSVLDAMAKSDPVHYYDPSQNKNVKLVAKQLYPTGKNFFILNSVRRLEAIAVFLDCVISYAIFLLT